MTRGPRRLKDDPDFKWETGCDLGDEGMLVGEYDLPGIRERLIAAAATSTPPVTVGDGVPAVRPGPAAWKAAAKPAIGVLAGAALIASSYWLGVRTGRDASDRAVEPPAPVEQAEPAHDRVPPPIGAPREITPAPAEGSADEPESKGVAPRSHLPSEPAAAIPAAAPATSAARAVGSADEVAPPADPALSAPPAVETEAAVTPAHPEVSGSGDAPLEAPGRPQPTSDLREYQLAYEQARTALTSGEYGEARERFQGLLARWPDGELEPETELGLLQALHGLGDPAATLGQAEKLQQLSAFARHGEEIARLRAESLVLLGRCEEALLVAEQLSVRGAAEIRRICRQQRKESP